MHFRISSSSSSNASDSESPVRADARLSPGPVTRLNFGRSSCLSASEPSSATPSEVRTRYCFTGLSESWKRLVGQTAHDIAVAENVLHGRNRVMRVLGLGLAGGIARERDDLWDELRRVAGRHLVIPAGDQVCLDQDRVRVVLPPDVLIDERSDVGDRGGIDLRIRPGRYGLGERIARRTRA